MKTIKKVLAAIMSATIVLSTSSGIVSEAIYRDDQGVLLDLDIVPDGCMEFRDTDLYKNHQIYFASGGPYVYRSQEYSGVFFAFPDLSFGTLYLEIDDAKAPWSEIYQEYKSDLNFTKIFLIDDEDADGVNKVTLCNSIGIGKYFYSDVWDTFDYNQEVDFTDAIELAQNEYNQANQKFAGIMDMINRMKESGCIHSAHYTAFCNDRDPLVMKTQYIYVRNYSGTLEELESVVHEVSPYPFVTVYDDGVNEPAEGTENYQIEFPLNGYSEYDTAEEFFKLYESLKGREEELGVEIHIPPSADRKDLRISLQTVPTFGSRNIDCFVLLDILGDVNIDGRIGIQDVIAMHKYISEIIELNYKQSMAADINFDSTVNNDDLDILLHMIVDQ